MNILAAFSGQGFFYNLMQVFKFVQNCVINLLNVLTLKMNPGDERKQEITRLDIKVNPAFEREQEITRLDNNVNPEGEREQELKRLHNMMNPEKEQEITILNNKVNAGGEREQELTKLDNKVKDTIPRLNKPTSFVNPLKSGEKYEELSNNQIQSAYDVCRLFVRIHISARKWFKHV